MAKPNYQFEKRQKELAKKNKKEEKRRQKEAGKTLSVGDGEGHSVPVVDAIPGDAPFASGQ